jgi:hypothetical protein
VSKIEWLKEFSKLVQYGELNDAAHISKLVLSILVNSILLKVNYVLIKASYGSYDTAVR